MRALSAVERTDLKEWAAARGYRHYTGSSIKGDAGIDWSDHKAREALLLEIVSDADRLLELARRMQDKLPEECDERGDIVAAAELLGRLLLQDVERKDDGVGLSDGVASDRTLSVNDPEMRHGHKSSSRRFDGHKAAVAVDTGSQLVTAVDELPSNAWDSTGALELIEQSEAGTGVAASETVGDTAYGDGQTRQAFADVGRQLVARMPGRPRRAHIAEEDFLIDVEADTCTCLAGNVAAKSRAWGTRVDRAGRKYRLRGFRFDAAVCRACPLRDGCVAGKSGAGRTVQLHPQEKLFQGARAMQRRPAFDENRKLRVVVEHRLARLLQLGIRQARYIGRVKTKFQLYLAATVANLTLLAGRGLPVPPAPALGVQSAILLSFAPPTRRPSFCWMPPFNRNLSSLPRVFGQVSRSGALS